MFYWAHSKMVLRSHGMRESGVRFSLGPPARIKFKHPGRGVFVLTINIIKVIIPKRVSQSMIEGQTGGM